MTIVKKVYIGIICSISLTIISGCSGPSKKSCNTTNWNEKGFIDGKNGIAAEKILRTEESCSKMGVDFPISDYKQGWIRGIGIYCSAENGFNMASEGKRVEISNCPIELRPVLVKNITLGKEYAGIESKIKQLQKQKDSAKDKRDDAKEQISKLQKELESLKSKKSDISATPEASQIEDKANKRTKN